MLVLNYEFSIERAESVYIKLKYVKFLETLLHL